MPVYIKLPCLHQDNPDQHVKSLWVGQPLADAEREGYWRPAHLPLDFQQARTFIESLRGLDAYGLEAMRHGASMASHAKAGMLEAEMASLRGFARQEAACAEESLWNSLCIRAQRLLLWCWLQEELNREIGELSRACMGAERALENIFLEDDGTGRNTILVGDKDPGPVPPWRVCMANAALFLPEDAKLVLEGEMGDFLADMLDFIPDEDASDLLGRPMSRARAPLWRALGHTREQVLLDGGAGARLGQIYCQPRIWIMENAK